jgi:hypothetical protein
MYIFSQVTALMSSAGYLSCTAEESLSSEVEARPQDLVLIQALGQKYTVLEILKTI